MVSPGSKGMFISMCSPFNTEEAIVLAFFGPQDIDLLPLGVIGEPAGFAQCLHDVHAIGVSHGPFPFHCAD
jgi:hypothetical protein